MTKKEYVNAIAKRAGLTKKDTEIFLNAQEGLVQDIMKDGGEITIPGVAKFAIKDTAPRKARAERKMKNGLTGKEVVIPAQPAKPAGKKIFVKLQKTLREMYK